MAAEEDLRAFRVPRSVWTRPRPTNTQKNVQGAAPQSLKPSLSLRAHLHLCGIRYIR